MKKYPEIITDAVLESLEHISDAEIAQDITDTEVEIKNKIKESEGYARIADAQRGTPEGKMAAFRQQAAILEASERAAFVLSLGRLQAARKAAR